MIFFFIIIVSFISLVGAAAVAVAAGVPWRRVPCWVPVWAAVVVALEAAASVVGAAVSAAVARPEDGSRINGQFT